MSVERKFVTYKGQRMAEGWPEKIQEAQTVLHYVIGGKSYARVPYGQETRDWGAGVHPCRDCGVVKGELHVVNCDVEECPICSRQAITCDCVYEL